MSRRKKMCRAEEILAGYKVHETLSECVPNDNVHRCVSGFRILYPRRYCPVLIHRHGSLW